jgi:para-nitrobenzyl esterase
LLVERYRSRRPEMSSAELWLDLATDAVFRMPAIALLEAQLPHAPAWSYLFTWETPVFGGLLRSTHALEIPFVFDNLQSKESTLFTGTGPERGAIADAMHQAWIAFARTGEPSHAGLRAWPSYTASDRATMRFDARCELLTDPAGADRADFFAAAAR